jgi:hypothetical protein
MLPDAYLIAGLDAMCRTYRSIPNAWGGFVDGHLAAGMLSAYFLAQEHLVEPGAIPAIRHALDTQWMGRELFQPLPQEAAVPHELDRLVAATWDCVGTISDDPHAVIFPAFALKALRHLPSSITRSRIDALCRVASLYAAAHAMTVKPWTGKDGEPIPNLPSGPAIALPPSSTYRVDRFCDSVLDALSSVSRYHADGHIWTYGCAVLDLYELGYTELARKAEAGYRHFLLKFQVGLGSAPRDTRKDPPQRLCHPEGSSYWESLPPGHLQDSWGHSVKYPYAYLQCMRRSRDEAIRRSSEACAYLLLDMYMTPKAVTAAPG